MEGDGKPVDSREGRPPGKDQGQIVHSMINRTILTIITIVLFMGIVSAVDFTPSGDINMRGIYSMKNATNITVINITASGFFIGNGSKIFGMLGSLIINNIGWLNWTQIIPSFYFKNQTYNKTEIDSELEKYLYINGSRQMTGNLNVRGSGNFSGTIYINNATDISTIGGGNESWNQSLANTLYYSISNPLNFMNWTQIIPHFYFKNQTYNKSEIDNNLSLKLGITDQRYNETGLINSVNSTLQNVNTTLSGRIDAVNNSLSIYNDTNKINSVNSTLNLVAVNASINHTSIVFGLWNTTWDNSWVNRFAYNHTSSIFTLWGQWFYNMTTPAISYADAINISNYNLAMAVNNTAKDKYNATYAGFITFNLTSFKGNLTLTDCTNTDKMIGIADNGTVVCATVSTYNTTYAGFITFNQSSLIANLTNGDCAIGSLVIGVQANGSVLCATDSSYNATYAGYATNVSINHTLNTFNNWNTTWDNSWVNQWAYNQTIPANAYTDSKLNTTFYNASTIQAVRGTTQGVIADIRSYNNLPYNVTEESGAEGIDFRVNFTGITEFNQVVFRYKSATTESHTMDIAVWDSVLNGWESYRTVGVSPDYNIMTMNIYDSADHIIGGVVQVRFYTSANGNTGHKHQFDWVSISKGPATPSSSETDPIYTTDKTTYSPNWYNHTSATFTLWGQWFYNMTTPAIDYVNNNFILKGTADAWTIKYQNISNLPTCSGTDKMKFDGTTLSCATDEVGEPGAGDISGVNGDDFITNGSATGDVQLIFNKTRLNETIISKGVDAGFNRTDNATYSGYITFNQTSLISNLTLTDCAAGNLVIGVQTNGTVLCATDAGGGNYFNQQLNTSNNVTFVNITMTNGSGDTFFLKRVFVYGIDLNITIYNSNLSNYNLGIAVNNTAKLVYTINTTVNIQNLYNATALMFANTRALNTTLGIQVLYNSTTLQFLGITNTTVNTVNLLAGSNLSVNNLTVAQNISMTSNYSIVINGKSITSNDTCIIIKGKTSTDYIC